MQSHNACCVLACGSAQHQHASKKMTMPVMLHLVADFNLALCDLLLCRSLSDTPLMVVK